MNRNMSWIGISVLGAALAGVTVAGCSKQDSNPDSIPNVPATTGNSTPSASPRTNPSRRNMPDYTMPGRGAGGMDDTRSGSVKPTDSGKQPNPDSTPTQGSGTGGGMGSHGMGGGMGGKMGTKPDSGRQADPSASPMPPSGGMGGDM